MRAKDIMTTRCITVSPSTPVAEIASLLVSHHISGVPVLEHDKLVGIVSEGDLLHRVEIGTDRSPRSWWLDALLDPDRAAEEFVKTHGKKARDVMSTPVITVTEDTPVAEIAETLERHRIKRVPVMRDDKLVGVVSRANLVQCIAATKGKTAEPATASDEEIRRRTIEILEKQPWASAATTSVFVSNGVVELWGFVNSPKEKDATRVAAEEIPGIKRLVDHRVLETAVAVGL